MEEGFGTADGIAGLDIDGLVGIGMRKGDAKMLMRNVSESCTQSGGDDIPFNQSGLNPPVASGNTTTTDASAPLVESCAQLLSRHLMHRQ